MTIDNLIVIKGGVYNDIKKVLRQWIDLYSKDLQEGLTFQLYKNGHSSHIIQADKRLDNERFYYLVNYLSYPEGIQYKINIEGFTKGKVDDNLKNKNLLVYISPTDKDYDNVFVTTSENENFKIDFSGKITETSEKKIYKLPNDLSFDGAETIVIEKKQNLEQLSVENAGRLERRFKIITVIVFSTFILTYLFFNASANFMIANYTLAFAVWAWLVFDYKILQINRLYFGSFVIGLVIFFYGYFLENEFSHYAKSSLVSMGTTIPIFLLVLQRPLRFAFKGIMKREPVVDRPAPSFADFVYMFILMMTSLIIPALYYTH